MDKYGRLKAFRIPVTVMPTATSDPLEIIREIPQSVYGPIQVHPDSVEQIIFTSESEHVDPVTHIRQLLAVGVQVPELDTRTTSKLTNQMLVELIKLVHTAAAGSMVEVGMRIDRIDDVFHLYSALFFGRFIQKLSLKLHDFENLSMLVEVALLNSDRLSQLKVVELVADTTTQTNWIEKATEALELKRPVLARLRKKRRVDGELLPPDAIFPVLKGQSLGKDFFCIALPSGGTLPVKETELEFIGDPEAPSLIQGRIPPPKLEAMRLRVLANDDRAAELILQSLFLLPRKLKELTFGLKKTNGNALYRFKSYVSLEAAQLDRVLRAFPSLLKLRLGATTLDSLSHLLAAYASGSCCARILDLGVVRDFPFALLADLANPTTKLAQTLKEISFEFHPSIVFQKEHIGALEAMVKANRTLTFVRIAGVKDSIFCGPLASRLQQSGIRVDDQQKRAALGSIPGMSPEVVAQVFGFVGVCKRVVVFESFKCDRRDWNQVPYT